MPKNVPKSLHNTISSLIPSMEAVPCEPSGTDEFYSVFFDNTEKDNTKWKKLISDNISTAKTFEIHCWEDEADAISLALNYGSLKQTNWKHGSVIASTITENFISMLLSLPKQSDTDIYNKMTPFFSIFFDNGFSSSHYGTENNIPIKQVVFAENLADDMND